MTTNDDWRQARYERACWWLERGVDIVPLKPRSKSIQPGYGSRQAHITAADFAHKWFLKTDANLGVVLGGAVSLAVADWDDAQDYDAWCCGSGATIETLIEQTARGYHAFFIGVDLPSATSDQCEFKTSGVCMVAPSVHPSGVIYRIVRNLPIASLTEEKARLLFPFLSEKEVKPRCYELDGTLGRLALEKEGSHSAGDDGVVARIKAVRSVEDEISASGVQLRSAGSGELVGLCPFDHGGHKDSQPSLWVNTLRQRWGCYAPGCESNMGGEKAHDVVNYRALSRGISNREAIKQLANELFPSIQNTGKL
jgi:hypothetical protein